MSLVAFSLNLLCLGVLTGNGSKLINVTENKRVFSQNLYGLIISFNNVPFRLRLNVLSHFISLKKIILLEG